MARFPGTLQGRFLVADLDLTDPPFVRSVILVLDHGVEGALGLVVNKPLGLTAAQIVDDTRFQVLHPERRGSIPLHSGGPVEPQAVFVLHTGMPSPWRSAGVRPVLPGLWFEPSFPAIQPYVTGQTEDLPPDDRPMVRLYLGYAGWSAGQLEAEVERGAWQVIDGHADLVFAPDPPQVWQKAMELRGGFWAIVAQTGIKPSLN